MICKRMLIIFNFKAEESFRMLNRTGFQGFQNTKKSLPRKKYNVKKFRRILSIFNFETEENFRMHTEKAFNSSKN